MLIATRGRNRLSAVATVSLVASLLTVAGGQAGTATAYGPVPARFQPVSASFVSGEVGFLLGTAPCAHATCTALVSTYDGGQSWVALPAPKAPVEAPGAGSSQALARVSFANADDGWAWGPALWSTHDGGVTWKHLALPPGARGGTADVVDLQASGGYAYALVASSSATAQGSATPLLERSPVGSDRWQPLRSISGQIGGMTWYGRTGWVVKAPVHLGAQPEQIWRTTDAGATWARLPDPCYQPSQGIDLAYLTSPDGTHLLELCAGNPGAGQEAKRLLASANGGATVRLAGNLPLGGLVSGMAAAGPEDIAVAANAGAGFLYGSTNGGRTWATTKLDDGGAGLSDLSYPSVERALVVDGRPGGKGNFPEQLLTTIDGGHSWYALAVDPEPAARVGPSAVWVEAQRYQAAASQACGYVPSPPDPGKLVVCIASFMRAHGASDAAVAYFGSTGSYLVGYVGVGRLAVGYTLTEFPMDCGCLGYVMLNGQYHDTTPPGPVLAGSAYASLRREYPELEPGFGSPPFVEATKALPGGREQIVFQFPLNNLCNACATGYRARVVEVFSASGAYLGSTSDTPCLGGPAPAGSAAPKVTVPEPACPGAVARPPV